MSSSTSAGTPVRPWRVLGFTVVTAGVITLAIVAGMWQYSRYQERADAVVAYDIATEYDQVEALSTLVSDPDVTAENAVWRTVTVDGVFADNSLTVLRNRPIGGVAAWQYLAWLETHEGPSLLVSLGWIPQPGPLDDPHVPPLPREEVTLTVVLRDLEEDDGRRGGATRITPAQMPAAPSEPFPVYGMAREWCVVQECTPVPGLNEVPLPSLNTGPHLSYAWQWWVFAALAPVGALLLWRREAVAADHHTGTDRNRARIRSRNRLSDEEIEDAL